MGFFDLIGNIVETVAEPVVRVLVKDYGGAVSSVSKRGKPAPTLERNEAQMAYNDPFSGGFGSFNPQQQANMNASRGGFFGNLGETIGGFGRDVGGFVQDIAPALNLFGIGGQMQRANAGTAISVDVGRPQETASSGEILGANLGLGANLIQAATRFARSPGGGTALGFGAGALGAAFGGGDGSAPRITRRMKSDVRRIYNMSMGNPDITAQILNQMGTYPKINFDAATVFFILTKRFRNDGHQRVAQLPKLCN